VKYIVGKINENVTEIQWLHNSTLSSTSDEKANSDMSTLEKLINQTSIMNREARNCIKGTVFIKLLRPLFF
jgi:uncharacterized membrane protein YgaE (UPF0421/DUF939 family)